MTEIVQEIPVRKVFTDPFFNCRGPIAPIDVVELARDIERNGLMQPIIVQPYENNKYDYKAIAGHRRLKAHEVLKWEFIKAIVKENVNEGQALISNLAENIHRKQLNILQEAKALDRLKSKGFSIDNVSRALGKSNTWVRNRYELLELPEEIQEAASAGFIKQNQIRDLYRVVDKKEQLQLAAKIKHAKVRGEQVPHIKPLKRKLNKKKQRKGPEIVEMMNHIQKNLGNNFGTRCLAWVAGEIPDIDLFKNIKEIAEKENLYYSIPTEYTKI